MQCELFIISKCRKGTVRNESSLKRKETCPGSNNSNSNSNLSVVFKRFRYYFSKPRVVSVEIHVEEKHLQIGMEPRKMKVATKGTITL
jgi:hypothetical protein